MRAPEEEQNMAARIPVEERAYRGVLLAATHTNGAP
jgi:hypothetical protein